MIYRNFLKQKYQTTSVKFSEVEGVPCIFSNSKGKTLKNYEIYGNSVQDGTPSPDNPIEIESVGDLVTDETSEYYGKYDIPIVVSGKNLLSYPFIYTTRTAGGVTWNDNCDGTVTVSGNVTNYSDFLFSYVKVAPNTQYCCSGIDETENVFMILRLFNKDDVEFKALTADGKSSKTILFNSAEYPDATYMRLGVKRTSNNATISGTIKPMIEIGTTATEFESCIYKEIHHIYLDEPLRKVGEYADYIDFKNQKVVRKVKSDTVNFSIFKYISQDKHLYLSRPLPDMIYGNTKLLSNKIKTFTTFPGGANDNRLMTSVRTLYYLVIAEEDEVQSYIDKMQDVALYYPLETVLEEDISLPTLKSFKGTSVMSINTSIQPSNIKAKYIRF